MDFFESKQRVMLDVEVLPESYYLTQLYDYESFRSVMVPAFANEFGEWVEEKVKGWYDQNQIPGSPRHVTYICHHDSPVGVIVIESHLDTIEILGLAVHPKYQNQGIAYHLIQYVKYHAWIHKKAHLLSSTRNPVALHVYQREGFICQESRIPPLTPSSDFTETLSLHQVQCESCSTL